MVCQINVYHTDKYGAGTMTGIKANPCFQMVVSSVRIGCEDFISDTTFLFFDENLLVKKVYAKWMLPRITKIREPNSQIYFPVIIHLLL